MKLDLITVSVKVGQKVRLNQMNQMYHLICCFDKHEVDEYKEYHVKIPLEHLSSIAFLF